MALPPEDPGSQFGMGIATGRYCLELLSYWCCSPSCLECGITTVGPESTVNETTTTAPTTTTPPATTPPATNAPTTTPPTTTPPATNP